MDGSNKDLASQAVKRMKIVAAGKVLAPKDQAKLVVEAIEDSGAHSPFTFNQILGEAVALLPACALYLRQAKKDARIWPGV